jgi:hypothetical protein
MNSYECEHCKDTGYEPNDTDEAAFDGDPCTVCRHANAVAEVPEGESCVADRNYLVLKIEEAITLASDLSTVETDRYARCVEALFEALSEVKP